MPKDYRYENNPQWDAHWSRTSNTKKSNTGADENVEAERDSPTKQYDLDDEAYYDETWNRTDTTLPSTRNPPQSSYGAQSVAQSTYGQVQTANWGGYNAQGASSSSRTAGHSAAPARTGTAAHAGSSGHVNPAGYADLGTYIRYNTEEYEARRESLYPTYDQQIDHIQNSYDAGPDDPNSSASGYIGGAYYIPNTPDYGASGQSAVEPGTGSGSAASPFVLDVEGYEVTPAGESNTPPPQQESGSRSGESSSSSQPVTTTAVQAAPAPVMVMPETTNQEPSVPFVSMDMISGLAPAPATADLPPLILRPRRPLPTRPNTRLGDPLLAACIPAARNAWRWPPEAQELSARFLDAADYYRETNGGRLDIQAVVTLVEETYPALIARPRQEWWGPYPALYEYIRREVREGRLVEDEARRRHHRRR